MKQNQAIFLLVAIYDEIVRYMCYRHTTCTHKPLHICYVVGHAVAVVVHDVKTLNMFNLLTMLHEILCLTC